MKPLKPFILSRRCLLTITLVLTSGCTHISNEASLPITLPNQFSASGEHRADPQWWKEFGNKELDSLIATALNQNFSLHAAQQRLASYLAQQNMIAAKQSPTLNGIAALGYDKGVYDRTGVQRSNTQHDLDVRFSWELDLWGKHHFSTNSVQYTVLENHARVEALALIISGEIARAWLDHTEHVHQAENLALQLKAANTILTMAEQRFQSGHGGLTAVLRQQQLIESLKANLAQVHSQRLLTQHALNVLMGQLPQTVLDLTKTSLPHVGPLPSLGIPAHWLHQRPDLNERWFRYQSRRYQAASLGAARLPNISLGANASGDADRWMGEFELWKLDLGIKLDVPLFDAGRRQAEHHRALSLEQEAFHLYTNQVLEALMEVEGAVIEETNQRAQQQSIRQQTQMAHTVLQLELSRYQHGTTSFLSVLEAQEKWLQLQRRDITQHIALAKRRVALHMAIGSGSPLHQRDPSQDHSDHKEPQA